MQRPGIHARASSAARSLNQGEADIDDWMFDRLPFNSTQHELRGPFAHDVTINLDGAQARLKVCSKIEITESNDRNIIRYVHAATA